MTNRWARGLRAWLPVLAFQGVLAGIVGAEMPGGATREEQQNAILQDEGLKRREAADDKRARLLAQRFHTDEAALVKMHVEDKLRWDEVTRVLVLSEKSKAGPADILALRRSGMSWAKIALKYNFSPKDISSEVRAVRKSIDREMR